jgi:molybdopterin/thiamine biosynthesis adenylyltransferase/rhodanese-related sulfurtransferase
MLTKYKAQTAIEEIGEKGQKKLLESSVLIVGLGGLGCPASIQLAATGIGKIGIVENDLVEETNLARQIIYTPSDIGEEKIEVAYETLQKINPDIQIIKHKCFLNEKNCKEIIQQYDVILDCTDNFQSRYLINDTCYFLKKPLISGMVYQLHGRMVMHNFQKANTPCARCIHPTHDRQAQSCSEAGVTNMITGIIGSMQANETLKFLLDMNINNDSTFLINYDSLNNTLKKIELSKNDECNLCGLNKTINEIKIIQQNCSNNLNCSMEQFIQFEKNKDDFILLDVRTSEERIVDGIITNDIHIQLDYLHISLDKIEKYLNKRMIIYCRSGIRSMSAVQFLKEQNFTNVLNLEGGIKAYNLYKKQDR